MSTMPENYYGQFLNLLVAAERKGFAYTQLQPESTDISIDILTTMLATDETFVVRDRKTKNLFFQEEEIPFSKVPVEAQNQKIAFVLKAGGAELKLMNKMAGVETKIDQGFVGVLKGSKNWISLNAIKDDTIITWVESEYEESRRSALDVALSEGASERRAYNAYQARAARLGAKRFALLKRLGLVDSEQ